MSFEGQKTNDTKRTVSYHEFDCLRSNSGYVGCACGKFCFCYFQIRVCPEKQIVLGVFIRHPKEIIKMERHFSALQRWLQKEKKIIIVSQILI